MLDSYTLQDALADALRLPHDLRTQYDSTLRSIGVTFPNKTFRNLGLPHSMAAFTETLGAYGRSLSIEPTEIDPLPAHMARTIAQVAISLRDHFNDRTWTIVATYQLYPKGDTDDRA